MQNSLLSKAAIAADAAQVKYEKLGEKFEAAIRDLKAANKGQKNLLLCFLFFVASFVTPM